MKLTTNPSVWRVALLAVIGALVSVGAIQAPLGDQINQLVDGLAVFVPVVLGVIGAIWSKSRTAPVAADTPPAKLLVRGADGVYTAAGSETVNLNDGAHGDGVWPDRT